MSDSTTGTIKKRYQYAITKLLVLTSICVDCGSPQKSENNPTSGGTTFHIMTKITPNITRIISDGYMRAQIILRLSAASFSICDAISSRVILSFPVFSHDSTMAISESEKLLGKSLKVVERFLPEWIFSIILASTLFMAGFFCWEWRIFMACRTVSHAFTIVARSL